MNLMSRNIKICSHGNFTIGNTFQEKIAQPGFLMMDHHLQQERVIWEICTTRYLKI